MKATLKTANSKKPAITAIKRARTILGDLSIEINPCPGKRQLDKAIAILWKIIKDNEE